MMIKFLGKGTVFLSALAVAACGSSPEVDHVLSQTEEVQVKAHMECQNQFGFNTPDAVDVLRLSDGRVLVSVVNGYNMNLSQVRSINQCARYKLLNQPAGTTQVRNRFTRKTEDGYNIIPGCIVGIGAMQGGSAICPGY